MKITYILVEPAVPENIGAAARAIKMMGFDSLYLVNPGNHLADKARWLAHASNEILENAHVFSSLTEAVVGFDFIIGTTAKNRSVSGEYISSRNLNSFLKEKGDLLQSVAVVFGREESGLTNAELDLCNIASYVPLSNPYPSINLAQSVMIYAYALSENVEKNADEADNGSSDASFQKLISKAAYMLQDLGFKDDTLIYGRIMERLALLGETDINLLHSVSSKYIGSNQTKEQ